MQIVVRFGKMHSKGTNARKSNIDVGVFLG